MTAFLINTLPWWEPTLALCAAAALISKNHWPAAFWLASYAVILIGFKDPSQASMADSLQHPLAFGHIILSWGAKIAILTAVCLCFDGPAIRHSASLRRGRRCYFSPTDMLLVKNTHRLLYQTLDVAIIYQTIAILLGMFWAFDDPAWGALWQWDFIEITALLTWICTIACRHDTTRTPVWAIMTLSVLLIQTLTLYGPLDLSEISRHAYANPNSAHMGTICFLVWALLLSTWGCYQTLISPYLKDISHPSAPTHIYGLYFGWIGTIVLCGLLPQTAQSQWATINAPSSYHLDGIRAYPEATCMRYELDIVVEQTSATLPLLTCPKHSQPLGYDDIWVKNTRKRIWALQYQADRGTELLIRPITKETNLQVILILFMLGMCVSKIKSSLNTKI